MVYDRELINSKLNRWEKYLTDFSLPEWDELPPFELYMEQVLSLLTETLDFLLYEAKSSTVITASTVNNYVRMKIMPPPVKKRYSRVHLAYLIIICTLKQSLNIAYVEKLIPMGISEDEVRQIYNSFVRQHRSTSLDFMQQLSAPVAAVRDNTAGEEGIGSLISRLAISANMYKLLTEKLIGLQSPVVTVPDEE